MLKHRAIFIETRNFDDYSRYRAVFERCGFFYEPHYDFLVDTASLEMAEANLGKSRKRDIRTSLRDGAGIVEDPTDEQIESFYAILQDLYESRVKTPLFPLDFFLKLNRTGFSKFLLVRYQDEIIGGTVCVYDDDRVYEWFACGKDGIFKTVFPSTLATWSGIRFAAVSGRKQFDMMGAGAPGDGGYGVRDFKAKFGGELVEYGRFKYVCNRHLYAIGKLGVAVLKKK
jgi:lipid II:glycine glycyltransferase (peptidoglycan interpeptide bridge formation enzyme)